MKTMMMLMVMVTMTMWDPTHVWVWYFFGKGRSDSTHTSFNHLKLLLIQISCNTLQIVHSLDVLRINQLWVGEQNFKDFLSKLTLGITFFEQIGLGSLARQNHICWAIEASKLRIAFGALLAAWVKKRLPSWYETQIADEDNCGLSVSPLLPPLSIEGDTVLAVVLHFTEQQQRRRKTQTPDEPALKICTRAQSRHILSDPVSAVFEFSNEEGLQKRKWCYQLSC